jgi:hypothetical protein
MPASTIIAALLLQAASPQPQPQLAGHGRASDRVLSAANSVVLQFLTVWRTAWLATADTSTRPGSEIRLRDSHCHYDGSFGPGANGRKEPPTVIHMSSRRSMCPNWLPTGEPAHGDEATDIDASLPLGRRQSVRAARARLIDSLAALDAMRPGDKWIVGQRVRFLVDQGERKAALDVARHCQADRTWCSQLAGYVLHSEGAYARADSAFDAATRAMTPDDRCKWTSVRLLLDDHGRGAYDHLNCDERVAANEKFWWLSTPMFVDTLDDRRSTDFARKVLIELRGSLSWDERFDWRRQYGRAALTEMLVRYGWPTYSAYGGQEHSEAHATWMGFNDSTRTGTLEYPRERLHVAPEWRAIADPFHATATAWRLDMGLLTGDEEPAAQWWPAEHYTRPGGPITQLLEQTVLLRRDDDVLLATAAARPGDWYVLDTSATALFRTTGPGKVERLPHKTLTNSQAIVVLGKVPATPAIVGAELPAAPGKMSARTRLGIDPPAPLSTLGAGALAISDPVLLTSEGDPPSSVEGALARMLGDTHVREGKLGVYWETYGLAKGDSVAVSVIVSRKEPLSKMRRLGMALHLAGDINSSVAVRWSEPGSRAQEWTIDGATPIQARAIRIDLSNLPGGRYELSVVMQRPGLLPVTTTRAFVYR